MPGPNEPIEVLRSFRRLIGTDEHNLALFDATLQSVSDRLQGTEPVGEVLRVEDGVARVAMYDSTLKPGALIYAEPTCAGTASSGDGAVARQGPAEGSASRAGEAAASRFDQAVLAPMRDRARAQGDMVEAFEAHHKADHRDPAVATEWEWWQSGWKAALAR